MRLGGLLLTALVIAASAGASDVLSYSRHANAVEMRLSDGWARVQWVTPSTLRFCRGWEPGGVCGEGPSREAVTFQDRDTPSAIEFSSTALVVSMARRGARLHIKRADGLTLLDEVEAPRLEGGGLTVSCRTTASERFFGLGPRGDPQIDARGMRVVTRRPFLISTRGYGLFYNAAGDYVFDLAKSEPGVFRLQAPGARRLDYFFYSGETPKEVSEQHLAAAGAVERLSVRESGILDAAGLPKDAARLPDFGGGSWESLRSTVHALINASLSAILLPALDLAPYRAAIEPIYRRASQLGAIAAVLYDSTRPGPRAERPALEAKAAEMRRLLTPYLLTYAQEAHDRGFPLIHPLPMQFPGDPQGVKLNDEFMLGDEILVAPALGPHAKRPVYFPMGRWTGLRTGQVYPGKRTVEIEVPDDAPAMFVKNGSIVPLAALRPLDPMTVHYFSRLGGEFFLSEEGLWDPTQLHAAPAGDFLRLETESKKDRDYEWVVHHMERPREVKEGNDEYLEVSDQALLANGCWYYDAARQNLHVRHRAQAGHDHIINVAF